MNKRENMFKVFIDKPFYEDSIAITFVKYEGHRIYVAEPIDLVFKEFDLGTKWDQCTLKISGQNVDDFLSALREAVEGKSAMEIRGELEATKYHLEDMRKLVNMRIIPNLEGISK